MWRDSEFLWSCRTRFLLNLLAQCFPHRNFCHFLPVACAVHCYKKVRTIRARRRHASFPSRSLCFDLQEQLRLRFLHQRMWPSSQNVFFQEKGKLKGNSSKLFPSRCGCGLQGPGPMSDTCAHCIFPVRTPLASRQVTL